MTLCNEASYSHAMNAASNSIQTQDLMAQSQKL